MSKHSEFKTFDPTDGTVREVHHLLLGGVAPRPIALVSTISVEGVRNLSPFSFFNAFGANPPTVAFSPSRRGRDGSFKDTYNNLIATGECVIHAVTYDMVHQASLASTEYPPDIDEFIKAGFTPVDSTKVKPSRVLESPFAMECRLKQMLPLGEGKASGNLAICEVILFHIAADVLTDGVIVPEHIDLVGRNSVNYYTRASGSAIFEVAKPMGGTGIGYDALPDFIRNSSVLSANDLTRLANSERMPSNDELAAFQDTNDQSLGESSAKSALDHGEVERAWLILLSSHRKKEEL